MTGGTTGMPSEFYGIDSGIYNSNNAADAILNIDFASGVLRPQIGGGGGNSYDKIFNMNCFFQHAYFFNMQFSNNAC